MAFSTFRGFFGASAANTGPVDSDTYFAHVPATPNASTDPARFTPAPIAGSSATWYVVGASNNNVLTAYIATSNGSYTSLGSTLALSTITAASPPAVDSVDSTHFVTTYQDSASTTQIYAQYITNTSGTLSVTAGPTLVVSGSGANMQSLVAVLDSSNALVIAYSGTTSRNRISLFNTATLSVTQSNTSATSIGASTTKLQMFSLSPTLAVIPWTSGAGAMNISTVDIVSGTSFTLNSAFSTGLTSSSEMVGYKVNSTTAVFVYYKSANTIAARTATIGTGGSVTLNTEYTATATGIDTTNGIYCIGKYASTYVACFNPTSGEYQAISFTLSGNVVSFDTNGQQVIVTNNVAAATAINGALINLDSTHLAISYFYSGFGGFNGVIQVNNTSQTWGTFTGQTSGNIPLTGLSTYNSPSTCWVGSQGLVTSGYITAGDLQYYSTALGGGTSGTTGAQYGSQNDSSVSLAVATNCALGFNSTNLNCRSLTAYVSTTGTTITTNIVKINIGNSSTQGTTTTFTCPGSSNLVLTTPGLYSLTALTADSGLFINAGATTVPTFYGATVITANTGLNTINTAPNSASFLTISGQTFGVGSQFVQTAQIDSTHVALLFQTLTTIGATYNLKMCIISISGSTATPGTIVTIASGYTNPIQSFGISVFTGSTSGMVFYTNDASPGTSLLANGFTYSGTTVTLGSQNSLATSQHIVNKQNGNGNVSMLAVSPTEAVAMWYDSTAALVTMRLLTYVNVNSITAGSAITAGATTTNAYLIASDNYNDTFTLYTDNGYTQYYRG